MCLKNAFAAVSKSGVFLPEIAPPAPAVSRIFCPARSGLFQGIRRMERVREDRSVLPALETLEAQWLRVMRDKIVLTSPGPLIIMIPTRRN